MSNLFGRYYKGYVIVSNAIHIGDEKYGVCAEIKIADILGDERHCIIYPNPDDKFRSTQRACERATQLAVEWIDLHPLSNFLTENEADIEVKVEVEKIPEH